MLKDIVFALIMAVCAWTDFKYRKIYNAIIGPGILLALFFYLNQQGWLGLIQSIGGLLTGIGLLLIPFILGGMGAGDVKLLGLVGAFNGPIFVLYAFVGTALVGGIMALVILLLNNDLIRVIRSLWSSFLGLFFSGFRSATYQVQKTTALPYGIAIALGTLGAYWVR